MLTDGTGALSPASPWGGPPPPVPPLSRAPAGRGQPHTHLCTVWEATRKDMRSPPVSSCPATREPPINRVPKTMPACGKGQTVRKASAWNSVYLFRVETSVCVCVCARTRTCVVVELTHLALLQMSEGHQAGGEPPLPCVAGTCPSLLHAHPQP